MRSDDAYRFNLSWPMETEEQLLAGEFMNKLGHRKSRFVIQLICDYLREHPEAMNPKETIQFFVNSTTAGNRMIEMIRSIIQTELAGKTLVTQEQSASDTEAQTPLIDESISAMLGNLDAWQS